MCLIIVISPYTTFVHGPNGNVCRTGKVKKKFNNSIRTEFTIDGHPEAT